MQAKIDDTHELSSSVSKKENRCRENATGIYATQGMRCFGKKWENLKLGMDSAAHGSSLSGTRPSPLYPRNGYYMKNDAIKNVVELN